MNICMITSSYPRHAGDGAGSFVGSLARALVEQGHTVHVVAPYDPAVAEMDQGGVHVHRFRYVLGDRFCLAGHGRALEADVTLKRIVPLLMPGFAIAAIMRVWALHRREPFDVLHGHWAIPGGVIADWIARLTGLPFVISLHGSDIYVAAHSKPYAALVRRAFRRAAYVTACSEDLQLRAAALGLDLAKSHVLPYGVHTRQYACGQGQRMRTKLGIPPTSPVIGTLGRLVHKKGFDHLIAAMPAVLEAIPEAYCVIGGYGDLGDALRGQAQCCGLAERVLFPGHIAWDETADFYAMCDVVAIPSVIDPQGNVDGLPNVLLEAMASGVPVVASRVAGIPAILQDGVSGILVPPGDSRALAEAITQLMTDPDQRKQLAAGARQAMAALDWPFVAAHMARIYEQAVGCSMAAT